MYVFVQLEGNMGSSSRQVEMFIAFRFFSGLG